MLASGERQVAPELAGIRRDHVARYEFAAALLGAGKRVVDFGCGVGYGAALLADAGCAVIGADRDHEAIAYARAHYARHKVRYTTMTAAQAPAEFTKPAVDAAVCFEIIEHLAEPLPLLQALHRAAPLLIASVPNETVFPFRKYRFHHRHYTRQQFAELLHAAGWAIESWHGQHGVESDVIPGIEGRTIVVTARRRAADEAMAPVPAAVAGPPEHVAILGLGPSLTEFVRLINRLGARRAYCDEVWAINSAGDVIACDRVFHMDDVRVQEARADANPAGPIAQMLRWLREHAGPVYTSVPRADYPGLVAYPLAQVLNGDGKGNGGAPYFNSTAAYAIALAVHIGVKKLSLFGIDFTLPNTHAGERGRACCEFWLGVAAARGIQIVVPEQSTLMDACAPDAERFYGYDCVEVRLDERADGKLSVRLEERAEMPSAAEIERRYDHRQHPNRLLAAQSAGAKA